MLQPIWSLTYQVTPGEQAQAPSGAYPQVEIDVHLMFKFQPCKSTKVSTVQLTRSSSEARKQAKQNVNLLQKCISYGERSLTSSENCYTFGALTIVDEIAANVGLTGRCSPGRPNSATNPISLSWSLGYLPDWPRWLRQS